MTSKPKFLVLNVLGKNFPLLETQVKPREGDTEIRTYYCFRESGAKSVRFGVKIQAQGEALPTQVTIDGVVVSLERGLTAATYNETKVVNGKKVSTEVTVPEEKRRPRASTKQYQVIPSLVDESASDTGIRNVEVSISETSAPGVWNAKIVVNRSGLNSASPEQKNENAVKRAANTMAEFDEILASMGL